MTDDDGERDLPRRRERERAAGQPERQEDLVGGVGHRGERVAGEDGEREALGEEGLAEPVAAHRAAEDHALDDTPWGRHDAHCMPRERRPCAGSWTAHRAADAGVASLPCTSSSWAAAVSARPWRAPSSGPGHEVAVIDQDAVRVPSARHRRSTGAPSRASASTATPSGRRHRRRLRVRGRQQR